MDTREQQTRAAEASNWRSDAEADLAWPNIKWVPTISQSNSTTLLIATEQSATGQDGTVRFPWSGRVAEDWGLRASSLRLEYTSQHYNTGSAPSTLAASLLKDESMCECTDFFPAAPGDWIRSNCHRMNVIVNAGHGRPLLALLEAFLHAKLRPRYER